MYQIQYLGIFQGTSKDSRCSHQGSGQTEDGEEGTGGGEGGVFADSGLFPHLYVCSSDVISQCLWYHGLPLLTQSNVTPEGTFKIVVKTLSLNNWTCSQCSQSPMWNMKDNHLFQWVKRSPHQSHIDGGEVHGRLAAVLVDVGDVLGQTQISVGVRLVLYQPEEVETREQSSGQLDVLLNTLPGIVAAIGRVGCC